MRPGQRYWLWSLGLAELLGFGLIARSATGTGRNDEFDAWVIGFYLASWARLCVGGALVGWATWAVRIGLRRAQRLQISRG